MSRMFIKTYKDLNLKFVFIFFFIYQTAKCFKETQINKHHTMNLFLYLCDVVFPPKWCHFPGDDVPYRNNSPKNKDLLKIYSYGPQDYCPRFSLVCFFIRFGEMCHSIICSSMDPLQWMGAVRMRVQTADKNITIIHTTPVHQITSWEDKICL